MTHHSRFGIGFLLVVSCFQHSIATNVGGIFKFGMLNLHVLKIKIIKKDLILTTYNLKLKWKYKNTNTKGNTVNFNKDSTSVLPETPQRVYVKFRVIDEQVSMQKRPSMLITVIQRQKNKSLLASPIFTKLNDKCKAKRQGMPQE